MPPKKEKKASPEKPKKESPTKAKKESPKDKKKASPTKGKGKDPEVPEEEKIPPPPPPPKVPPPPLDNNVFLLRQHWYPHADKPNAKIQENSITPYYALVTSWGDLWISDPPRRRIVKYAVDPRKCELYKLGDIVLRGEPYHMGEKPGTGRVFVILKSPSIPKVSILELAPETAEIENKIIFPFTPPKKNPEQERPLVDIDESAPIGMALNDGLLFIVRSPIQKMYIFDYEKFEQVPERDISFQGLDSLNPSCERVASSGGAAYANEILFVACEREAGILMFKITKHMCYSVIDRVVVRLMGRVQEPRLMQPFGVALDPLNCLLVTDHRWDYIRVFEKKQGKETCTFGGWRLMEMRPHRPGHISVSKNGVIAVVCHRHNEVLLFFDQTIFKWYHDTLFYLDYVHSLRTVVDRMAVPIPPAIRNKALFKDLNETGV